MIQEMLNLFSALMNNDGGAISSKPLTDSFGWTEDEVAPIIRTYNSILSGVRPPGYSRTEPTAVRANRDRIEGNQRDELDQ